jgi:hypothetical protein
VVNLAIEKEKTLPLVYDRADGERTFDVIEILAHWHAGRSLSEMSQSLSVDRKTIRKYVAPAIAAGIAADVPTKCDTTPSGREAPHCPCRVPSSRWLSNHHREALCGSAVATPNAVRITTRSGARRAVGRGQRVALSLRRPAALAVYGGGSLDRADVNRPFGAAFEADPRDRLGTVNVEVLGLHARSDRARAPNSSAR